MCEGWDPCPDWIVTCGGGLRWRREEAPTCLPILLHKEQSLHSGMEAFIHSCFLLLSLSPSLPFSKRLPATYWGSSPLLVCKAKDQQEALDSSWVEFIYEEPAQVPSLETLTFQGCTCNSWHQDPAWDPERRSRGSQDSKDPGGKRLCLGESGCSPILGAPGHQSRTEGPANARGNSGVCQSGWRKGYAPLFTWK